MEDRAHDRAPAQPEFVPETPEFVPEIFDPQDLEPRPIELPSRPRMLAVALLLLLLALLAFVPPLINVGRFRKGIAASIGASLGRPVRIDAVTLALLPLPGFTLQNFVVGEDPAFGYEPVLRANQVKATLRWGSLWRRRMEFSRITLEDPSVNLVHLPDGRWNLEAILLQAARVHAAPTPQPSAGAAPRFPYIEATGGRINLKRGVEKLPLAVTEATFALWQPEPDRWRFRLEARPARTDAAVADTGTLRAEATLGRAARLADVPIDLALRWTAAPLGAVSALVLGRDGGVRGDLSATASAAGTVGDAALTTRVEVSGLRRAEFVPNHPLSLDLQCHAQARANFHRLEAVHCLWPARETGVGLAVDAEVPAVEHPRAAHYGAVVSAVPAQTLLDALGTLSPRIGPGVELAGTLGGRFGSADPLADGTAPSAPLPQQQSPADAWWPVGSLALAGAALDGPELEHLSFSPVDAMLAGGSLTVAPFTFDLGGPVPTTLAGEAGRAGLRLHLSGSALPTRLLALAHTLPQLGDGLIEALPELAPARLAAGGTVSPGETNTATPEQPIHFDLTGTRTWNSGLTWTVTPPIHTPARRRVAAKSRRR